jgi:hypothetical protein
MQDQLHPSATTVTHSVATHHDGRHRRFQRDVENRAAAPSRM